jgi:hypothetical protein
VGVAGRAGANGSAGPNAKVVAQTKSVSMGLPP